MALKADPFLQRRLLDVASTDRAADTAAHRRRTLPELGIIAAGEQKLSGLQADVVVAETEVSDLDRSTRKLDAEVEQVRSRAERDRDRLASGAGTPRELEGLQHEIESLIRRQGVLEDEELELMELRETADARLATARTALTEVKAEMAAAIMRRDDQFADLDADRDRLAAARREHLTGIPADLLALYERIRGQGKVAAAELIGGQCGACRVQLDVSAVNTARSAPVDMVVRCDDCGAILVRN